MKKHSVFNGFYLLVACLCAFVGCYHGGTPYSEPSLEVKQAIQDSEPLSLSVSELLGMTEELANSLQVQLGNPDSPVARSLKKHDGKGRPGIVCQTFSNRARQRYLRKLNEARARFEMTLQQSFAVRTDVGARAIVNRIRISANGALEKDSLLDILKTQQPPAYLVTGRLQEHVESAYKSVFIFTLSLYDIHTGELVWTSMAIKDKNKHLPEVR